MPNIVNYKTKNKHFILRFIVVVLCFLFGISTIYSTTIRKQQGDTLIYSVPLSVQTITSIECNIFIDNPTVIFVDSVKLDDAKLEISKDYHILYCKLTTTKIDNPTLHIFATCLFGNDTVANINISNIVINNDIALPDLSPLEIIITNNQHLYTRFAKINKAYPVPCSNNEIFYIEYLIDDTCDVNITMTNMRGEIVLEYDVKEQMPNSYTITSEMLTNYNNIGMKQALAAGVYHIQLTTRTGNDMCRFVVVN